MMPVVKDPLMSGQRGSGENVVRQVVVVPFSSDRPGTQQQTHTVQSSPTQQASTMASTPEMQEEMRKLIDAARSAVADLQAAAPASQPEPQALQPVVPIASSEQPQPAPQTHVPSAAPAFAPQVVVPQGPAAPQGPVQSQAPAPYQGPEPSHAESNVAASQALQAATAMARATTALGNLAAANSGYVGMLPTVRGSEGVGPAGATRRIGAVIESLITRRNLNLRLAPALTQAFEGAELKASDYASERKMSKESAGRELRQAVEAGLLQTIRYPQGEAGFKASQDLLRAVAEGLGQPVNASTPLTPETIIGSLAVGQTEGTVTIMFTDVEGSTRLLSTRGFTESHEIMR